MLPDAEQAYVAVTLARTRHASETICPVVRDLSPGLLLWREVPHARRSEPPPRRLDGGGSESSVLA